MSNVHTIGNIIRVVLLFTLFLNQSFAGQIKVNITGSIYIPPCKVNNDSPIDMSFGKISLTQVDGQHFALTKTVNVMCVYHEGTPYIKVEGGVLQGAADNILVTQGVNAGKLGIALYQGEGIDPAHPLRIGAGENGAGYKINKGFSDHGMVNGSFVFTAVPYKKAELTAGHFSASATMSIAYQ
ncbi:fimbrial protein [Vagococcus sp. WN89Y]|uniref:fimbrial protein n=1 Tax=Vagococcus sp. WN89Y TaxID=3457258 RepID=UPI003FCE2751